jgi:diguanylate cyclase (GGDEF)-like protein
MKQYLLQLGRDFHDPAYFEERLRIGAIHERIGLDFKWYMGAYHRLFDLISRRLQKLPSSDASRQRELLNSLMKIFTLDSTLAIETYHQSTIERLETILRESAQAKHDLRINAQLDGLTGIRCRSALMEALESELHRSRRFEHPFTILLLDIDHFKQINDQFSHAAGDFILSSVASLLRSLLRPDDVIGRLGGEEFIIGLLETNEAAGVQIAERARLKIALAPFDYENQRHTITVSIGVAALTPDIDQVETLIRHADQAMYRAKSLGRNQVQSFSDLALNPSVH